MSGSVAFAAIDAAIGLCGFFLIVSLLCSAAREMIEAALRTRALVLERTVRELLGDRTGTGIARALFDHPLICGLYPGVYDPARLTSKGSGAQAMMRMPLSARRGLPSYIPAGHFAAGLLDLVARGAAQAAPYAPARDEGAIDVARLRRDLAAVDDPAVRRAVAAALDGARTVDEARRRLELWFDGVMDRASGWYKRHTQWVLLALGLGTAILLNLDGIAMARRLIEEPAARPSAANAAVRLADAAAEGAPGDTGIRFGWSTLDGVPLPRAQAEYCPRAGATYVCADGHPPAGLVLREPGGAGVAAVGWGTLLLMPLGWLVTALAVTLGAPFWFDLLNRFMLVRATVRPRQKSREDASLEPAPPPAAAPVVVPIVGDAPAEPAAGGDAAPAPAPAYAISRWRIGRDPDEGRL